MNLDNLREKLIKPDYNLEEYSKSLVHSSKFSVEWCDGFGFIEISGDKRGLGTSTSTVVKFEMSTGRFVGPDGSSTPVVEVACLGDLEREMLIEMFEKAAQYLKKY
jgi:hypothetical protein